MAKKLSISAVSLLVFVLSGCIASDQLNEPESGFYENKPIVFSAPYDEVWNATIAAVREVDWFTKTQDRRNGLIKFMYSYVYNSYFDEYKRVYKEPSKKQLERSKIKTYLRNIAYYEQSAPPTPLFVKERMKIKVDSISINETTVFIDYKVMPFYDYKVGYLGTLRSRGRMEKGLFKRIQDILNESAG